MTLFLLQSTGGGFFADPMNFVLLSGILMVMYFLMIRPNQRKAKEAKEMLDNLKKGDEVVTAGGIYAKVHKVDELTLKLDIAKNTIITIDKNFISQELTKQHKERKEKSN